MIEDGLRAVLRSETLLRDFRTPIRFPANDAGTAVPSRYAEAPSGTCTTERHFQPEGELPHDTSAWIRPAASSND
jgi:hypothetical protein